MTWYASSWSHMHGVNQQAVAEGKDPAARAKAIDDSYPWAQRSGWAYKAWLSARRDYFRKQGLPLRRAKKPQKDLIS